MGALLKISADGQAYVAEGADGSDDAAVAEAVPRKVEGGRGDARLATYVRKPTGPQPSVEDYVAAGYVGLEAFLADPALNDADLILGPTDDPRALAGQIGRIGSIAILFPKFSDGRGYSTAALLRTRLEFRGELRAVGDVLRDQLFYLRRVGFDAFALRADQRVADCLAALNDFSDAYQWAPADARPALFRRRQ